MAGSVVADTLQDGAGNSTSMDNAIFGSAKAWVQFTGSTATKNASYNVSSVTRTSTGQYTINFTNAFVDANYVWAGNALSGSANAVILGNWSSNTNTASAAQITAFNYAATNFDCTVGVAFFR